MNESPSEIDPVEQLAESFLEQYRRGERPGLSEYTKRHPELAEQIRELFPALMVVEELGSVSGESSPGLRAPRLSTEIPQKLGEYRILRVVGRGGMGVVFEAVQESLGRHVALKVLPLHGLLSPTHKERFRREARAAARLHHTNIVPVFGVGETDGINYYAMQFIHGQGLNEVLREVRRLRGHKTPLDPRPSSLASSVAASLVSGQFVGGPGPMAAPGSCRVEGAVPGTELLQGPATQPAADHVGHSELTTQPEAKYFRSVAQIGIQVAEALEYAHGEGILHRDIKPSNLILDTTGRVWVTDFGLAKAGETDELTDPGDIVGTLCYMAPERFQSRADARSDVYGLGITLYELLTLERGFVDPQRARLIERITNEEPRCPRKIDPRIPRDLETIVLKAIAKEPSARYPAVRALAEDLRSYLADRPVRARRTNARERAWRWCRRNPAMAALIVLAVASAVVMAGGASLSAIWLRAEASRARQAQRAATEELWKSYYAQAQASRWSGRAGQRFGSLDALKKAAQIGRALNLDQQAFRDLRNLAIACLTLADIRIARQWEGYPAGSTALAFDSRLQRYALGESQGTIRVCRTDLGQEIARLPASAAHVVSLRFSPDGRFLASTDSSWQLGVWDIDKHQQILKAAVRNSDVVDWTPDGRRIAVGLSEGSIGVYDMSSGREATRLTYSAAADRLVVHPDGRKVAVSEWQTNVIQIRDLLTGEILSHFKVPRAVYGLSWSPDGEHLACGCKDGRIYLWDVAAMKQKAVLAGHELGVRGVCFDHSGALLASQGLDGTLRLWDVPAGKQLVSIPGSGHRPQFSQDSNLLAGIVQDTQMILVQVNAGRDCCSIYALEDPDSLVNDLDFSPDGRLLAAAGDDGVRLWDLVAPRNVVQLSHVEHGSVLFQPDGSSLIGWSDSDLRRWPTAIESSPRLSTGPVSGCVKFGSPETLCSRDKLGATDKACWGPDGHILLLTDAPNSQALVLDPRSPQNRLILRRHDNIGDISMSPDGEWIATGGQRPASITEQPANRVRVWEARSGRPVTDLLQEGACVAFSPDNQWLVTGTTSEYRFWQVGSWRSGFRIPRADALFPGCVAFTRDAKTLAVTRSDRTVQLIHLATRAELARLASPEPQMIVRLRFNPDGNKLAVASENNLIQVWNLGRLRAELAMTGLDWDGEDYPSAGAELDLSPLTFGAVPQEPLIRFEAEDLNIVQCVDCNPFRQGMDQWNLSQWSHGRQLFCVAPVGGFVALEFDFPRDGRFRLDICFTKARDYGILEVFLDGKKIGTRFDGFDERVVPSGKVDFGIVPLTQGRHRFGFKMVDKNRSSINYCMGIDCLEFRPVN